MGYEKIKLVAFDLGYTLLFNIREESYMAYLKKQGIPFKREEVEKAFHLTDKDFMRNYPGVLGQPHRFYFPWYIGLVNYYFGHSLDIYEQTKFIKTFNERRLEYWRPFPWTKRVLTSLKENGYILALLSNWDLSCRQILEHWGIAEDFEHIFVSSEVGVSKPDPRIFDYLISASRLKAEHILYVGDNYYDDFVGAKSVGMEAVIINRFGSLGVSELKDVTLIKSAEEVMDILGSRNVPKKGERKNA